eukprot:TRINITY_DN75927_c0_g1_i1.p1 TRINITY_DN75927_c0_g1~~TRINITY_DN75927_c0_g1_i1.p1  ORF type:complete len:283 (+),score=32.05 TRINITY_DN75927_c0_g1_i1:68-916(+)
MHGLLCAIVTAAVVATSQGASLRHGRHEHSDGEQGPLRGPPGPYSAPGKEIAIPALQDVPVEKEPPKKCGPKCEYDCHKPPCHAAQECDPVCEAPKCEITCSTNADKCQTRCGEPMCVVVCPKTKCEGRNCSSSPIKCKTVCSEPVCTTSCTDNCKTSCQKPVCRWNCKKNPRCAEPVCDLKCKSISGCSVALSAAIANKTAPTEKLENGRVLVATGRASVDPSVLDRIASAAPAPAAAAVPTAASDAPKLRVHVEAASTPFSRGKVETKSWAWGALKAPTK